MVGEQGVSNTVFLRKAFDHLHRVVGNSGELDAVFLECFLAGCQLPELAFAGASPRGGAIENKEGALRTAELRERAFLACLVNDFKGRDWLAHFKAGREWLGRFLGPEQWGPETTCEEDRVDQSLHCSSFLSKLAEVGL